MLNLPSLEWLGKHSRRYGGRVARSAFRRRLRRRCVYMHLPKCGGTTVSEGLYATVPLEERIGLLPSREIRRSLSFLHLGRADLAEFHDEGPRADALAAFREQLVLLYMSEGRNLIHGHFLFTPRISEMAEAEGYDAITILRDPIARTVSNYRMAARNGIATAGFDAFLESEMGRRMAQHALRYFSGRASIAPDAQADAMEAARANLARFVLIGFLDDLAGFAQDFGRHFGNRPRFGHLNRGGHDKARISESQRRRLEALCAPDLELTELARDAMRAARGRAT